MDIIEEERYLINNHDMLTLYLCRDDNKVGHIHNILNEKYGIYCKIDDSFSVLRYTFYIIEPKFYGLFYKKHVIGELAYFNDNKSNTYLRFALHLDKELKQKMIGYITDLILQVKEFKNKESLERIKEEKNNTEEINRIYKQQKGF